MRKLFVVCLLVGSVALVSCTGSNSPSGVVKAFMDASKSGDKDAPMEYVQSGDRDFLEKMHKAHPGRDWTPPVDMDYSIGEEKIEGDKASVVIRSTQGGKERSDTMKLVREDGRWKLDLIPDEMIDMMGNMGGMMEAMSAGMKGAVEDEDDADAPEEPDLDLDFGEGVDIDEEKLEKAMKESMDASKKAMEAIEDSLKKQMEKGAE